MFQVAKKRLAGVAPLLLDFPVPKGVALKVGEMTEEASSTWRGPGDSAQAEARRERRRKGQEGKAPWQPIVLPDDEEEDRPAPSARSGPTRPLSAQVGL